MDTVHQGDRDGGKGVYHINVVDEVTPYEKLKSLDSAQQHLRTGVTFAQLDAVAHQVSDFEAAQALTHARNDLFRRIHKDLAAA